MRQAIVTKYLGPTNTRGSRIKASCEAGSLIVPYDSALNSDQNHQFAAKQLHMRLGWDKDNFLVHGWNKHQGVHVQLSNKY